MMMVFFLRGGRGEIGLEKGEERKGRRGKKEEKEKIMSNEISIQTNKQTIKTHDYLKQTNRIDINIDGDGDVNI